MCARTLTDHALAAQLPLVCPALRPFSAASTQPGPYLYDTACRSAPLFSTSLGGVKGQQVVVVAAFIVARPGRAARPPRTVRSHPVRTSPPVRSAPHTSHVRAAELTPREPVCSPQLGRSNVDALLSSSSSRRLCRAQHTTGSASSWATRLLDHLQADSSAGCSPLQALSPLVLLVRPRLPLFLRRRGRADALTRRL